MTVQLPMPLGPPPDPPPPHPTPPDPPPPHPPPHPRITVVSASAGSGKTYRLATELKQALGADREAAIEERRAHTEPAPRDPSASRHGDIARPEAVLATTFTRKAAAELRERARRALLEAGRVDDAHRLAAARIGTVNAVCGRIVSEFAFELGQSPDLRVLDEPAAKLALHRAMSRALTDERSDELEDIKSRFPGQYQWRDDVTNVVNLSRANAIEASQLDGFAERSAAEVARHLNPVTEDDLDRQLAATIEQFLAATEVTDKPLKGTIEVRDRCEKMLLPLTRGRTPAWADWQWLASRDHPVKIAELLAPLNAAAERHMEHPRLHADLRRLIQLVFEVARETLTEYAAAKRQWGVIDFADQELLCLSLLDNPRVRDRLKNELDLVLVDEFQDTSPVELAIFTRLAELAGKSIWVGDQKQAIFGFRGTSPELMDAAVAEIAGAAGPESLATSYRSRPELVRLSSDVFGTAFAALGFEERLVRLEPASDSEPSGLGPVTEWWRWSKQDAGNKAMDARTLASGVRTLLADPTVRVRDLVTKAARAVRPSDVAVLCRTNSSAAQVAGSLEGLGVRALIPRPGLLATPEGQLLLSGVRLWVDPRDRLGLATVARLVGFPGDPDAWLAAALGPEGAAAFDGIRQVAALRAAANTRALAGPVEVIDIIVEALGVREECLAWGDASQRLANVEQVRAVSAAYVDESRAASGAATPAGLAAHLLDLAGAGEDMQAVVATDDAVTVSTWHQAKGLEWPVTVLFDLDFWRDAPPIGVSVASDAPRFDLRDPLRDRWIRLWPTPHYSNSKSEYHARVNDSAEAVAYRGMEEREALRVLYVGWTRARDRVVLAGRDGKHAVLAALADGAGTALVSPPAGGATVWAGRPVDCLVRNLTPAPPTVREPQPGVDFLPGGPVPHAPARAPASGVKAVGLVGLAGSPIALGPRFAVADGAPMELVGQALHGFLAADRQQPAGDGARLAMAALLLQRWGVGGAFRPEDAVEASDRLHGWVHSEWPAARWRREWPLYLRLASGTVVSGTADLLLELDDDRFVLIDHKTFPGAPDEAASRASEYAGQLGAYAAAIEAATGRHLVAAFIHMPVLGLVVAVTPLANQLDWHT